jgi:hypothetical protein
MDDEELARQVDEALGDNPVGDAMRSLGFCEARPGSLADIRVAEACDPLRLIGPDDQREVTETVAP